MMTTTIVTIPIQAIWGILAYLLVMWITAFWMGYSFYTGRRLCLEIIFCIFFGSLLWPIVVFAIVVMGIGSIQWVILKKCYSLMPSFLHKVLYWTQFVVRPIRLAEICGERARKREEIRRRS